MRITATTRDDAGVLLGIGAGPDGAPCRRDLADAVRRIVAVRGAAPKEAVLSWIVETCRALGHPPAAVRDRLESVITDMALAGDLVSLACDGAEALAPKPGRAVIVAPGLAAVLGVSDGEGPGTEGQDPNATIRLVPADGATVRLADELGPPSYRNALAAMALPHGPTVTLREFAGLVFHELVRNGTEADPTNVETLGRLSGDGTWAYGKADLGGSRRPAALRLLGDGTVIVLPLPDHDALGWLALCGIEVAGRQFAWTAEGVNPPRQFSVALAIAGTRKGPLSWALPEGADVEIAAWIGSDGPEETAQGEGDPDQRAIVSALPSARLVVEAGPGSGKTWVACRRIARLVEEGVPAAHIVVVSFTRAAVGELRARVASFLSDPAMAADLTVWTLDSLAWRLRAGFPGEEDGVPANGYEANVLETLDMLAKPDAGLIEFVAGIGHLVVDEAQDLVGARRDLVAALVAALASDCGVTVFMDGAQAIYGWQGGAGGDRGIKAGLLARGFTEKRLDTDHRTRTPRLKAMFVECRKALLDGSADPHATYHRVRETVERYADGVVPHVRERAGGGSTFMLFRSRAELLASASELWSVGVDFGLRLSGRRPAVGPWIAATLSRVGEATVSRAVFDALWDELWPPPVGIGRDAAWTALRRVAPSGAAAVDMARLRSRLSAAVPPPELAIREHGGKGLVLATIHGAKGWEADHVRLMMPRVPSGEGTDWGEEARILFVGATRARKSLRVGSFGSRLSDPGGIGRLWQEAKFRTGPNARVEIGAEGDVDEAAQISATSWGDPAAAAAQARLWSLAGRQARIVAERVAGTDAYALTEEDGDGTVIGFLSRRVLRDLLFIGRAVHGEGAAPPRRIRGLHLIGVRTVAAAVAGDGVLAPHARSGLWLVPVVAGLAPVFFSVRGNGDA